MAEFIAIIRIQTVNIISIVQNHPGRFRLAQTRIGRFDQSGHAADDGRGNGSTGKITIIVFLEIFPADAFLRKIRHGTENAYARSGNINTTVA